MTSAESNSSEVEFELVVEGSVSGPLEEVSELSAPYAVISTSSRGAT